MRSRINEKIKLKFVFVAFLLLNLSAKAQNVNEQLGNFSELKTFNGVEVMLFPANRNAIEITGHSKDKVKFEIVDDRLEIRLSLDNIWSKDNTLIKVFAKSVTTIDANEGSVVEVQENLKADDLVFRAQEGAQIYGRLTAKTVYSKAISGGQITLEGKAEEQEVDLNTGGLFAGGGLKTKETVISAGTAGRGEIYASEYCKATAKLGGTIKIEGNPDKVDYKTSLGGKIL
jgi:hypothetical protein